MAEIVFNPALLDIQTQDLDWIAATSDVCSSPVAAHQPKATQR
jgi:hypothetical protein